MSGTAPRARRTAGSKAAAVFHRMADIIPEHDGERFAVVHFEFTPEVIERETERCRELGILEEIEGLEAGTYVKLVDKEERKIVMSDTWMERRTNAPVVDLAHGHVLIGGLGIGLILVPLWRKEAVRRITVLEKHREVIDLVLPHLRRFLEAGEGGGKPLEVVYADVFAYEPPPGTLYDTIYFDIWNDVDPANREQMRALQARYARYLRDRSTGWIGSWREDALS